ncbi:hypothetical protein HAX54_039180, partial [Datura stramonium]|nr:hypothetical protein [Datura stramonium]
MASRQVVMVYILVGFGFCWADLVRAEGGVTRVWWCWSGEENKRETVVGFLRWWPDTRGKGERERTHRHGGFTGAKEERGRGKFAGDGEGGDLVATAGFRRMRCRKKMGRRERRERGRWLVGKGEDVWSLGEEQVVDGRRERGTTAGCRRKEERERGR